MLRTLLLGILAVSAAASCSKKSDAPAATPGAPAGKVVEVSGSVTATRGTEVRTLAAGGEISSDDVIDTAADSRIVILVAHNNARWDLGPNKHGKVGDSLAWTAAKQDRPAIAVTEETSTAGKYADKNAATTDTTTASKSDPKTEDDLDMQPKGSETVAAEAVATDRPTATATVQPKAATRRKMADVSPSTTAPQVQPPPKPDPVAEKKPEPKPEAPKPEAQKIEAPKIESQKNVTLDRGVLAQQPGSAGERGSNPQPPTKIVSAPEQALQVEIRKTFSKQRSAMRACFEATAPSVMLTITVTKGAYAITSSDPAATAKARTCLATVAKGLGPATMLDAPVTLKILLAK